MFFYNGLAPRKFRELVTDLRLQYGMKNDDTTLVAIAGTHMVPAAGRGFTRVA